MLLEKSDESLHGCFVDGIVWESGGEEGGVYAFDGETHISRGGLSGRLPDLLELYSVVSMGTRSAIEWCAETFRNVEVLSAGETVP